MSREGCHLTLERSCCSQRPGLLPILSGRLVCLCDTRKTRRIGTDLSVTRSNTQSKLGCDVTPLHFCGSLLQRLIYSLPSVSCISDPPCPAVAQPYGVNSGLQTVMLVLLSATQLPRFYHHGTSSPRGQWSSNRISLKFSD